MHWKLLLQLGVSTLLWEGANAALPQEWLGGKSASYVIKSVEPPTPNYPAAKIVVNETTLPIYVIGSIRIQHENGSTSRAKLDDLKPGLRIRAQGGPNALRGFQAFKVFVLRKE